MGEEPVDDGAEFGVGDVGDDDGFADGFGEDEAARAGAVFLVAGGGGEELVRRGAEARQRAVSVDDGADAVHLLLREEAAHAGKLSGCEHAPADGFAVEQGSVICHSFDGMTEGMAVVEDHAEAAFALIESDDFGFHANGGGDDSGEGGVIGCEDGLCVAFHVGEERGVANDACLDALIEACAEFALGEGVEDVRVCKDGAGVVEATDQIFAGGEIDTGFATDRRVDLRKEGGWDLDVVNAAHVDGSEEAGDVADDAAAEGDEERGTVGSGSGEASGESFYATEAFVGLAGGQKEHLRRIAGGEAGKQDIAPEGPDFGRGDDKNAAGIAGELAETPADVGQESAAEMNGVVCSGNINGDGASHSFHRIAARRVAFG